MIGQRNTPVLISAHNNTTFPAGIKRNGATQPVAGATDTTFFLTNRATDEAFQHNKGADLDADQNCLPPTHLPLEATRLTSPDDVFTHTVTALGKRTASAPPPDHNTPTSNATAIPVRLNRCITLCLCQNKTHFTQNGEQLEFNYTRSGTTLLTTNSSIRNSLGSEALGTPFG